MSHIEIASDDRSYDGALMAAGKMAIRQIYEYIHNGVSFIRESTLPSKFDMWLMNAAREAGYAKTLLK